MFLVHVCTAGRLRAKDRVPLASLQSALLKVVVAFNFSSSQTCFLLRYMFSSVIRADLVRHTSVLWVSASGCCWIFPHINLLLISPTVPSVLIHRIFILSILNRLENKFVISAKIQRCDGEEQVCVHVLLVCVCVYVHLSTNVFQKKKKNEWNHYFSIKRRGVVSE